jgi:hypothetical protein
MSMPTVTQVHPSHKSRSFLDLLDRPIAFHRIFVTLAGSFTAAGMLSQALYWTRIKLRDQPASDGWFYKTQAEWEEETGLTRSEQETARKHLRKTPFWGEARRGIPAKLYFRVDLDALERVLLQQPAPRPLRRHNPQQNHQNAEIPQTRMRTFDTLDRHDPTDQYAEIPQTITETTAETTTEISPEIDINVGNVGTDREKPTRRLRLSPRQEELVEVLEEQFEDTHSRGAFCRIVSDAGLGEEVAARLLRETLEQERHITGPLGAYFIAACQREAQRQGIALGFQAQASRGFTAVNPGQP